MESHLSIFAFIICAFGVVSHISASHVQSLCRQGVVLFTTVSLDPHIEEFNSLYRFYLNSGSLIHSLIY